MTKNKKPVEIVLHINENLKIEQINHLESLLCSDNGVTDARVNLKRNHLMLVDYIPGLVTAQEVVNYVRDYGYRAELVGGF